MNFLQFSVQNRQLRRNSINESVIISSETNKSDEILFSDHLRKSNQKYKFYNICTNHKYVYVRFNCINIIINKFYLLDYYH